MGNKKGEIGADLALLILVISQKKPYAKFLHLSLVFCYEKSLFSFSLTEQTIKSAQPHQCITRLPRAPPQIPIVITLN